MSEHAPSGSQLPNSQSPGPDEDPAERAERLYRRWDAVRARSALEQASGSGVRGGLGFARRALARIRDLGIAWDLQRDLVRVLLDRQLETEQRLRGLKESEVAIEQRLRDLEESGVAIEQRLRGLEESGVAERLAAIEATQADILGALNTMWKLHDAAGNVEMANLRDRHEILRVRQTRLEGALATLREELAALRGEPAASPLPLTPLDVAEILADLEKGTPEGERPGAVEISFQDARAEPLLLAARRHFGGRLSSSGPSYRGPNDLWIHVDFTAQWNRPVLLDNAAARLQPGGRFLLVTAPGAGAPPQRPELVLAEDREMPLRSGGPVRVLGWIRS
jgi:hypothetical protein